MSAAPRRAAVSALYWGIKESFREYVLRIPDGVQARIGLVDGGAGREVGFPERDSDLTFAAGGNVSGEIRYAGETSFGGYRGSLAVNVRDPSVRITSESIEISADIAPRGFPEHRVVLASGRSVAPVRHGDVVAWVGVKTVLTEEGARLLGGVYNSGDPADAATIHTRSGRRPE